MRKFSKVCFEGARDFLITNGRKLEAQLYRFHFEPSNNAQSLVIQELRHFQNPDGGFGKALEPDVRMKGSSVVATKFALQILLDIDVKASEPLVQNGVSYLLNTYDHLKQLWLLVSEKVMEEPHAPWWDFQGLEKEFGGFLANPKAGILRCLLEYQELVPKSVLNEVKTSLMTHFNKLPLEIFFFDAISFLQLLQSQSLEDSLRNQILNKLKRVAKKIVETNPDAWKKFSIKPLWLAPSPKAPLAEILKEDLQRNLDFEIQNQSKDGSWSPTWKWDNQWPDVWEIAEQEWKGILTLAMLRSLRDFNRFENNLPSQPEYIYKYHID